MLALFRPGPLDSGMVDSTSSASTARSRSAIPTPTLRTDPAARPTASSSTRSR